MKRLKLYGVKKIFVFLNKKGFVADVFVRNGKTVVEAKNQQIKKEIEQQIDFWLQSEYSGPLLPKHEIVRDNNGRIQRHTSVEIPQKPKDPDFLLALSGKLSENKIAGYKILFSESKIVEE